MHNKPTEEVMKAKIGETQIINKTVNIANIDTPKMDKLTHAMTATDVLMNKPKRSHLDLEKHDSKLVNYAKALAQKNAVVQPMIYLTVINKLLEERSKINAKLEEMIDVASDIVYDLDKKKTTELVKDIKVLSVVQDESRAVLLGAFDE